MTIELSGCSDEELVSLAIGGKQTAYSELARRHRDWVYRLVRAHIGDREEGLDVTQSVFLAAFSAIQRFDRSRTFRLWLARIALNKCKDWNRRRMVRRFLAAALPLSEAEEVADSTPSPEVAVGDQTELNRVMKAIALLPTSLREPLILHTIDGLSQAETAETLGMTEKAIENRIYRARCRLQEQLKKI